MSSGMIRNGVPMPEFRRIARQLRELIDPGRGPMSEDEIRQGSGLIDKSGIELGRFMQDIMAQSQENAAESAKLQASREELVERESAVLSRKQEAMKARRDLDAEGARLRNLDQKFKSQGTKNKDQLVRHTRQAIQDEVVPMNTAMANLTLRYETHGEVSDLKTKLADVRSLAEEERVSKKQLQSQLGDLEVELEAQRTSTRNAGSSLERFQVQLDDANARLSDETPRADDATSAHDSSWASEQDLRSEVDLIKTQVESNSNELARALTTREALAASNQKLQMKIEELATSRNNEVEGNKCLSEEVATLRTGNQQLQERLEQQKEEATQHLGERLASKTETSNAELHRLLEAANAKTEKLVTENANLRAATAPSSTPRLRKKAKGMVDGAVFCDPPRFHVGTSGTGHIPSPTSSAEHSPLIRRLVKSDGRPRKLDTTKRVHPTQQIMSKFLYYDEQTETNYKLLDLDSDLLAASKPDFQCYADQKEWEALVQKTKGSETKCAKAKLSNHAHNVIEPGAIEACDFCLFWGVPCIRLTRCTSGMEVVLLSVPQHLRTGLEMSNVGYWRLPLNVEEAPRDV